MNNNTNNFGWFGATVVALIFYFWLGKWAAIGIVALWAAVWLLGLYAQHAQNKANEIPLRPVQELTNQHFNAAAHINNQCMMSLEHHLPMARAYWYEQNYDAARAMYQKIAYANRTPEVPQPLYDAVVREQAAFARDDYLYSETLSMIKSVLTEDGPTKQTDLYQEVDADREAIKYVLYFADVVGDLKRDKAGRTYLVSLA